MERGSTAAASSTPLHYPSAAAMQAVVKVAPALAAGCAVLLKPSPLASLSCLQLEAIATEAGLPHPYPDPDPDPNPNPNPNPNPILTLTPTLTLTLAARTRAAVATAAAGDGYGPGRPCRGGALPAAPAREECR